MVKRLAEKTALFLAKGDEDADVEVLTYGYYMFYQQWLVIIAMLLLALPFGLFFAVLASITAFMTLRGCAGGAHATHPVICKIAVFALAYIPSVLAIVFEFRLPWIIFAVLYLLCVAMLIRYAPGETDVKKFNDPRIRKRMKVESLVWTAVFFLAAVIFQIWLPAIAFVLATTAFLTCCFVLPLVYWLFGFDPVTKEPRKQKWQPTFEIKKEKDVQNYED